jgi:hypothetical protein
MTPLDRIMITSKPISNRKKPFVIAELVEKNALNGFKKENSIKGSVIK